MTSDTTKRKEINKRQAISRVNHENHGNHVRPKKKKKKKNVVHEMESILFSASAATLWRSHTKKKSVGLFSSVNSTKNTNIICGVRNERARARISEWLTPISSCERVAHVNTIRANSTYVFQINFTKLLQFHWLPEFSATCGNDF